MMMTKPTLLLVDDNDALLRLLKSIFDKQYSVFTAGDGVEAIHLLSKGIRPRLILCDVQMQNIDGMELVSFLSTSRLYRDIPVILLTEAGQTLETPGAGNVARIVQKPFDPVHLLETVNGVLAQTVVTRRPSMFTAGSFFTTSKS
ncbi:response regulator [Dinghuibacter silviterrae]|nr:response regulator [Dinghuibacter silviterrae]